jgi:hypothetical protein
MISRRVALTEGTHFGSVEDTLRAYRAAVQSWSPDAAERVFDKDAQVVRPLVPGGPLVSLSVPEYLAHAQRLYEGVVAVHETTESLTVDVGGHVAVARLDFTVTVGDECFKGTDFICLARVSGVWKVTYVLWDARQVDAVAPDRDC